MRVREIEICYACEISSLEYLGWNGVDWTKSYKQGRGRGWKVRFNSPSKAG